MKKISKKSLVTIVTLVGFFALILCIYVNSLTDHTLLVNGDGLTYFLSKFILCDGLSNGEIPMWNPYVGLGTPYLGDIQQTLFTPANILYILFGSVLGFNIFHIIQLVFAGFSMFLLIRKLYGKTNVAIWIGIAYSLCAMLGGVRIDHTTIMTTIAMYPIIIYFFESFRQTSHNKYLFYSSICMAIQFVSGFTQIVIYFNIVCFVYLLMILVEKKYSVKKNIALILTWGITYVLLICIQLIPTLQLMISSRRDQVPYDFFSVLSYDLRILLMMFIPDIFSNPYVPYNDYASSGIDIEIYIGLALSIFILYAIRYHYKDKNIRMILGIMLATFIFGMAGNIPVVGKIIYRIPIIGSFRACARILSIFIFFEFVLVAYVLVKLLDKKEAIRCFKFATKITAVLLLIVLAIYCVISQDIVKDIFPYNIGMKKIFIYLLLYSLIINILLKLMTVERLNYRQVNIVIALLMMISIIDVCRYSVINDRNIEVDELFSNNTTQEINQYINEDSDNYYRSFIPIDEVIEFGDNQLNVAKLNRSIYTKSYIYNSYLTFIDNKLRMYDINETVYYPKTIAKLQQRNDLISMMSIHYIIDAWNTTIPQVTKSSDNGTNILVKDKIEITEANKINVYSLPLDIQSNSMYNISFELDCSDKVLDLLYVDFYNDNYDNIEQDGYFDESCYKKGIFKTTISTYEVPDKQIYFRIVSNSNEKITIKNLEITKVDVVQTYPQIYEYENTKVYENINVKPMIYAAKYIKGVKDFSQVYKGGNELRLDECSYIIGYEEENLSKVTTDISNINITYNTASATVKSDGNTFINHSQLYYPGWKAYIDNKETELYEVNGLIQGIYVPEGEHEIKFVYSPLDVKIGFTLSIIGFIMTIAFIAISCKKQKYD